MLVLLVSCDRCCVLRFFPHWGVQKGRMNKL
uniref:Uncharacterized protein n=1 Tax=Arundo donax TaxID=35708 RepID=A0A0A9HMI1_ARUDO